MTTAENTWHHAPSDQFIIEKTSGYEVSIKWKIEKFSVTATKADQSITSPKFHCADAVWSLVVYPNGTRAFKNVGYVIMLLKKISSPTAEHSTIFKFDVIDEHQNKVFDMLPLQTKCEGNGKLWTFCTIKRTDIVKKASGILPQDTLTVSFDLTVLRNDSNTTVSTDNTDKKEEGRTKKCKHCLKLVKGDFETLHNNPRFSDVTLKLGQSKFPAHKVVLGSRSKVFEAMFEHDMKENKNSIVKLVEMEVQTVRDMLQFIYCGDVRQLSPGDAINLYVAADRYDMQELVDICRKIILKNISSKNICKIAIIADLHADKQLNETVKSFMSKNIKEVIKTEKWKMFSKQKSDLSVKLLESVIMKIKN